MVTILTQQSVSLAFLHAAIPRYRKTLTNLGSTSTELPSYLVHRSPCHRFALSPGDVNNRRKSCSTPAEQWVLPTITSLD